MQLNITIEANSDDAHDMMALAALIAALGGRVPAATIAGNIGIRAPQLADEPEVLAVDHSDEDADIVSAAVAAGAPKYDSAGIPWDERIHSASRNTVADGTWRRRKNTPDATYDAVMAELIAARPTTGGREQLQDDTPLPPTEEPARTAPVADVATVADEDDTPLPPAQDTGPDLSTFAKFVQAVMDKDVPDATKTYAALGTLCSESFGVGALKDMKDKPGSWALFYDMVG